MEKPIIDVEYEEVHDDLDETKDPEKEHNTNFLERLKIYLLFAVLLFSFLIVFLWLCEVFAL